MFFKGNDDGDDEMMNYMHMIDCGADNKLGIGLRIRSSSRYNQSSQSEFSEIKVAPFVAVPCLCTKK